MDCLETNAIALFVEQRLSPEQVADVERHIDACEPCRRVLAEIARARLGSQATLAPDEPCCPTLEQMIAASEGSGDPAVRLAAIEHADRCASCRRLLSHLCAGRSTVSSARRMGRYTILEIAGAGAMGLVYKAHDPELDRMVAIKMPKLEAQDSSRYVREARAQALLSHPNIVAIHDVGMIDGRAYIVMDWVDGMTLRRWLRAAPRSTGEILAVFEAIGRGLAAAHRSGLVHQDIKPDNVMIDADGRPQITDFGVARRCDSEPSPLPRIEGTPAYMAPEQLRGIGGTALSDQFSFCVSLWEALFGARPVVATTVPARSRHVVACLRRGLAPDPADRFPTMEALLDALRARRRASRLLPATFAIAGAVALATLTGDLRTDEAPAIALPMPPIAHTPAPAAPVPAKPVVSPPADPAPAAVPHRAASPRRPVRSAPKPPPAPSVRSPEPPRVVDAPERLDDRLIDPMAGLRGAAR